MPIVNVSKNSKMPKTPGLSKIDFQEIEKIHTTAQPIHPLTNQKIPDVGATAIITILLCFVVTVLFACMIKKLEGIQRCRKAKNTDDKETTLEELQPFQPNSSLQS